MKTTVTLLLAFILSIGIIAAPAALDQAEIAAEAAFEEDAASLADAGISDLLFFETFDSDNVTVNGNTATLRTGASWTHLSENATDATHGFSGFRFVAGDSGNASPFLTRITDGDNGYLWVRTTAATAMAYPGFIIQFTDSQNTPVILQDGGTYAVVAKIKSPAGDDTAITGNGIQAKIGQAFSGGLVDATACPSYNVYKRADRGEWAYIWTTYTASAGTPLARIYINNQGSNASGIADFRSFYIDNVAIYHVPEVSLAMNDFLFTFVDGETQSSRFVSELETVDLPTLIGTREFLGWSETEGGDVLNNTKMIAVRDMTLYAVWGEPVKTDPRLNIDFFANTPVSCDSTNANYNYEYGMETTAINLATGSSTCNPTHAVQSDPDGTNYRRFRAQQNGDLLFQLSASDLTSPRNFIEYANVKGVLVRWRLNVPENAAQPTSDLKVTHYTSVVGENAYPSVSETLSTDASLLGDWQYTFFSYAKTSPLAANYSQGSMRRFDVYGMKNGWSIDVDSVHFVLKGSVAYDVAEPVIAAEIEDDDVVLTYAFDDDPGYSAAQFDALVGNAAFGTGAKGSKDGKTVYAYTFSADNMAYLRLPSVWTGVTETVGSVSGVYLPSTTIQLAHAPKTKDELSLRTTPGNGGIRFSAFVDIPLMTNADEHGFLVSRASFYDGDYSDFVFPDNPDYDVVEGTTIVQSNAGKLFVGGVSYSKANDIAKYYVDMNGNSNGFAINGVAVGLTGKQQYMENLVARPYALIDGSYFYGTVKTAQLYELAKKLAAAGDTSDYVTDIISACEN